MFVYMLFGCCAPQVPDFLNAKIGGLPAVNVIRDDKWFKHEFTPTVAQRGGALIKKWGKSSAASTAVSVADAIRALVTPTAPGDCFSSAVCSDGEREGGAGVCAGWRHAMHSMCWVHRVCRGGGGRNNLWCRL